MSPLFADINVINLSGDARGSTSTMTRPDGWSKTDDALKTLRLKVEQIKADAKTKADAEIEKARQEIKAEAREDASDKEDESSAAVTIHNGGKSVIVHKKSNDEDMVFAAIPIVAIVFTFLYLIIRAIMAPFTNRNKRAAQFPQGPGGGLSADEAELLTKLHRTLTQMESRVESLETILIDATRTKEKYGTKL